MTYMEFWNKSKQPPVSALKKIKGGRLSGMTDISPQWRYQVMTEHFGPAGVGWYYEIKKTWSEDGTDGQRFAFAQVELYTWNKEANKWSAPIYGVGGSMLVAKEKSGLHSSDEGYKMAVTDALSVAMKMLGVAADIYLGKFDGSKYAQEPAGNENGFITKEQVAEINRLIKETSSEEKAFLKFAKAQTVDTILATQYPRIIAALKRKQGTARHEKHDAVQVERAADREPGSDDE